jgi:hypothetical protein
MTKTEGPIDYTIIAALEKIRRGDYETVVLDY